MFFSLPDKSKGEPQRPLFACFAPNSCSAGKQFNICSFNLEDPKGCHTVAAARAPKGKMKNSQTLPIQTLDKHRIQTDTQKPDKVQRPTCLLFCFSRFNWGFGTGSCLSHYDELKIVSDKCQKAPSGSDCAFLVRTEQLGTGSHAQGISSQRKQSSLNVGLQ